MHIDILSLFPSYFESPFSVSIIKRAQEKGLLSICQHNIRDYAGGRHKKVDDRPYGGGPGMVLMPEPLSRAIDSCISPDAHIVYFSPQGKQFTSSKAEALSKKKHLIFICGHYEGIDERIITKYVHEEISIGDYVLTNGCLAACVALDALIRFIPNALGHQDAASSDSFENGLFDYPQYTQPTDFQGDTVPAILLSGDHQKIAEWRKKQALEKTYKVRPELAIQFLHSQTSEHIGNNELQQCVITCSSLSTAYSFYSAVFGKKICQFTSDSSALYVTFSNCTLIFIEGNNSPLSLIIKFNFTDYQTFKRKLQNISYDQMDNALLIQDPFGTTLYCKTDIV